MLHYVATPYTKYHGGLLAAYRDASRAAGDLMLRGYAVFSPIAHCHSISMHSDVPATDHEVWLTLDRYMMEASGMLLVVQMPGWEESYGIAYEIAAFKEMEKPIKYLTWPGLKEIASGP